MTQKKERETICVSCVRLKQGLCYGEKGLTSCLSYKQVSKAGADAGKGG